MEICTFTTNNLKDLATMAVDLWGENTIEEMKVEYEKLLNSKNVQVFLYKIGEEFIGFIHMSIRVDYVEGSNSSPVAYIEGIYVKPEYRGKNIASQLVKSGEQWSKSMGCSQLGSDIESDNQISYDFHKKVGFTEVNRIICFIKNI